jgi:hypothetical protein
MDQPRTPTSEASSIEVAVTRTGGFAGLQRRWHAVPHDSESSQWVTLIRQCPWGESAGSHDGNADPAPSGADRFVWLINARCGDDLDEQAELADEQVTGAWLALIDAVREWSDTGRA